MNRSSPSSARHSSTACSPIEAVAGMRIMAFPPFLEKAPSRRLAELAEAERGAGPAGQPEFSRAAMVGAPIAVGRTLDGPFTLMEGYTRCCRALRDQQYWPLRWSAHAHGGGRDGANAGVGLVVSAAKSTSGQRELDRHHRAELPTRCYPPREHRSSTSGEKGSQQH